jgi:hypothetical protein
MPISLYIDITNCVVHAPSGNLDLICFQLVLVSHFSLNNNGIPYQNNMHHIKEI